MAGPLHVWQQKCYGNIFMDDNLYAASLKKYSLFLLILCHMLNCYSETSISKEQSQLDHESK